MKAVQIVNPSEMKVVELEKPTVGAGEVLVRIKYVGFSPPSVIHPLIVEPIYQLW